ncbi:alpha/beta hydrolase fold protein [Acholeplasma sp. CAG:878]|jgi:pimeloyl-ACP methyl ester carboxylesterase|nr:alpha/beta hydrolase fold protein [Acholeplasma sp. CAG:878]
MNINGVFVNYTDVGSGEAVVLLHGWGQNIQMMEPIGNNLVNKRVIIIDLPGHGKSEEPKEAWTVYDYASCIHTLLTNLKIDEPILIGHSFGGKISLVYASKYKTKKVIGLACPFKKQIVKLGFKTKALKFAKKIPVLNKLEGFAKKHIGSTDYKNASEMMRKIMVLTVNTDITEDVKKIKCPTLLIWGTNDLQVSIDDAYELEKLIKDCGVVVYDGCTHYAYLERLDQTLRVIKSFIGE